MLGRYELVEEIGEGGMATVYRARDRELRRDVALKVLFPHLARREDVVRRFHREARAAAGLEHPNILRVYDVGGATVTDAASGAVDPPYIVMELIRGRSLLGELEQRGPMLAEVVACLGALLADALSVAHQAGIIHRDVKPANVMIAAGGRVLLADFGVARLETEDSLVTKTGALLGTPAYMSPEQASGDTATARSDLYSLGATLYQLATGVLPYSGSPAKVMAQIAQAQLVSAVRRRSAVGPDLSRVIDRLMAAEPTARPARAADVADELRRIAAAGGLGDPKAELGAYFAEPEAFVKAKLPAVVAAILTTAERAIADDKLPRAMALADRASALAPDDPAVGALIQKVTEGNKSTRRRRVLAIVAAGAVLAGGASIGAMKLFGDSSQRSSAAQRDDASLGATNVPLADAGIAAADATPLAMLDDAAIVARREDAGRVAVTEDARRVARRADAGLVAIAADAGVPPVARPDAAPPIPPVDAAVQAGDVAAFGAILVRNDTWCDVSIDGRAPSRNSNKPIRVAVGHHLVTCAQPGLGKQWTREVDVAAGGVVTVAGSLLGTVTVTLGIDASIDGVAHRRGASIQLKANRYEVVAGDQKAFLDIRVSCTLRTTPELACY